MINILFFKIKLFFFADWSIFNKRVNEEKSLKYSFPLVFIKMNANWKLIFLMINDFFLYLFNKHCKFNLLFIFFENIIDLISFYLIKKEKLPELKFLIIIN